MSSLRETQERFAAAVLGHATLDPGLEIYRRNIAANYRNALAATYPVVERIVGRGFFATIAADYAWVHPSTSGDLNEFGGELAAFLRRHALARELPYLADVAQLEWAVDESARSADAAKARCQVAAAFGAIAPERLMRATLRLHPAARLLACQGPAMRIWQIHQPGYGGLFEADLGAGPECLLVSRPALGVAVERISRAEHAWLKALSLAIPIGVALEAALAIDPRFDVAAALTARVADATIADAVSP